MPTKGEAGVLQITFSNAPEIFSTLFKLRGFENETSVVSVYICVTVRW